MSCRRWIELDIKVWRLVARYESIIAENGHHLSLQPHPRINALSTPSPPNLYPSLWSTTAQRVWHLTGKLTWSIRQRRSTDNKHFSKSLAHILNALYIIEKAIYFSLSTTTFFPHSDWHASLNLIYDIKVSRK